MSVIRRWLCRRGVHRWGYGTAVDVALPCYTAVTYAWCTRKECAHPATIVDVETRWIPLQDV